MLAGIFIELTNYIAVVVDANSEDLQDLSTRSTSDLSTHLRVHSQYVSTYNPTTNPPPSLSTSAICTYAHMHICTYIHTHTHTHTHTHIHISSRHRSSFFLLNCGSRPLSEVIFYRDLLYCNVVIIDSS